MHGLSIAQPDKQLYSVGSHALTKALCTHTHNLRILEQDDAEAHPAQPRCHSAVVWVARHRTA
jgi:hypothetical protein